MPFAPFIVLGLVNLAVTLYLVRIWRGPSWLTDRLGLGHVLTYKGGIYPCYPLIGFLCEVLVGAGVLAAHERASPLNEVVGAGLGLSTLFWGAWFIKELVAPTIWLTPPWILDEMRRDRWLAETVFGRRAARLGHQPQYPPGSGRARRSDEIRADSRQQQRRSARRAQRRARRIADRR